MKNLLQILTNTTDSAAMPADSVKVMIKGVAEEIAKDPNKFLSQLLQQAIDFGLKLLAAIVIYAVGAWLIKKVKNVLTKFFEKKGTESTLSSFITSAATITLTVLLLIITIGTLGVNTTSFAAILAAGGMAIGMALSGTVQNFAGGLMILLFKPFKVGDYIKAQGYEGLVVEVTIVSTKIRTFANSLIVIPNGALSNGNIDNFSHKPVHRCQWNVGVSYGSDAAHVKKVILDILRSDERIIDSSTPGAADPVVHLNKMNDSSVEFVVWAWVNTSDYWPVTFSINERIYTELPKNGIQFPFPQIDVHMIKE